MLSVKWSGLSGTALLRIRSYSRLQKLSSRLLVRPANFTRTQARLPGSFMIGEEKHPSTTHPRRGATTGSTVNLSSPVSPHHVIVNSHGPIPKCKPFAAKQLQLTPGAATVSADSSVG